VIPTVIVAANGWDMDMWSMHGRGQDTAGDPVVRGGSAANVRIEDFAFTPGNLEVPVGATVTWTNQDSAPHDATARDADWKTARLSNDESDTLTFTSRGTFDYYCSIHPSMKARLEVR
jgi:plastocyanin